MQTKQKARLAARHQQAMSTHLGHVIETTERYTMWLTEGIAGAKQSTTDQEIPDKEIVKDEKSKDKIDSLNESDAEFLVSISTYLVSLYYGPFVASLINVIMSVSILFVYVEVGLITLITTILMFLYLLYFVLTHLIG